MEIQFFVQIVQLCRTQNLVFIVLDPADRILFIVIVLIPDVSHDFFQKIFQGDHSHGSAIFIQYDGEIDRILSHFYHQLGGFLIFIGEIRFTHDIADMKFSGRMDQEEIFDVDDSNHIVAVILINRNTGETFRTENLQKLFIGTVDIHAYHIYPRDHNILGGGITEIKHVIDHLAFVTFDDAIFVADIHNGTKFMFCHEAGLGIGIHMKQFQKKTGQVIDDKNHRCQDLHEERNDIGVTECEFFRMDGCQCFRGDLSEHQYQKGQNTGSDTYSGTAEEVHDQCGGQRGSTQIDNVVSN